MSAVYILIIFISTSSSINSGSASVSQEFETIERCESAGKSLTADVYKRGNNVLTWGCFKK